MVFILGNEFKHLHESLVRYCLNIGTVAAFLILKKEESDGYILCVQDGGEDKPLTVAPSVEMCQSLIEAIMSKHVTVEPHHVIDIDDLYPIEGERTGEEVLSEMCQTLIDLGYEDLVDEFDEKMANGGSVSININKVNEHLEFGEENGLQAQETQTEEVNENSLPVEEKLETPE